MITKNTTAKCIMTSVIGYKRESLTETLRFIIPDQKLISTN